MSSTPVSPCIWRSWPVPQTLPTLRSRRCARSPPPACRTARARNALSVPCVSSMRSACCARGSPRSVPVSATAQIWNFWRATARVSSPARRRICASAHAHRSWRSRATAPDSAPTARPSPVRSTCWRRRAARRCTPASRPGRRCAWRRSAAPRCWVCRHRSDRSSLARPPISPASISEHSPASRPRQSRTPLHLPRRAAR